MRVGHDRGPLEELAVLAMVLIVLASIVADYKRLPRCLSGHTVTVHVAEEMVPGTIEVGDIIVAVQDVIPAHDEQRFVCDLEARR